MSIFGKASKAIHKLGHRASSTANKIGRRVKKEAGEAQKLGRKLSTVGIQAANTIQDINKYVQASAPLAAAVANSVIPGSGVAIMGASTALDSLDDTIRTGRREGAKLARQVREADQKGRDAMKKPRAPKVSFGDGTSVEPEPRPDALR